ncbi:MAG: hypothetical protein ACE367_27650, partial [Acidimicrobiales bacterium]
PTPEHHHDQRLPRPPIGGFRLRAAVANTRQEESSQAVTADVEQDTGGPGSPPDADPATLLSGYRYLEQLVADVVTRTGSLVDVDVDAPAEEIPSEAAADEVAVGEANLLQTLASLSRDGLERLVETLPDSRTDQAFTLATTILTLLQPRAPEEGEDAENDVADDEDRPPTAGPTLGA